MSERHAKISDLPGWPCPPRVRDIPNTPDSWGWVMVSDAIRPAGGRGRRTRLPVGRR